MDDDIESIWAALAGPSKQNCQAKVDNREMDPAAGIKVKQAPVAPQEHGAKAEQSAVEPKLPRQPTTCPYLGTDGATRLASRMQQSQVRTGRIAAAHLERGPMGGSVPAHVETGVYGNPSGGAISGGHHYMQMALVAAAKVLGKEAQIPPPEATISHDVLIETLQIEVKQSINDATLSALRDNVVLISWDMLGRHHRDALPDPMWAAYKREDGRIRKFGVLPERDDILIQEVMDLVYQAVFGQPSLPIEQRFAKMDDKSRAEHNMVALSVERPLFYKRLCSAWETICLKAGYGHQRKLRLELRKYCRGANIVFVWNETATDGLIGSYPIPQAVSDGKGGKLPQLDVNTGAYRSLGKAIVPGRMDMRSLFACSLTDPGLVKSLLKNEGYFHDIDPRTEDFDMAADCPAGTVAQFPVVITDLSQAPVKGEGEVDGKPVYQAPVAKPSSVKFTVKERSQNKRSSLWGSIRAQNPSMAMRDYEPECSQIKRPHNISNTRDHGGLSVTIHQAFTRLGGPNATKDDRAVLGRLQKYLLGVLCAHRVVHSGATAVYKQPVNTEEDHMLAAMCALGQAVHQNRYRVNGGKYYAALNAQRSTAAQEFPDRNLFDEKPYTTAACQNVDPTAAPYLMGVVAIGTVESNSHTDMPTASQKPFTFQDWYDSSRVPQFKHPLGCAPQRQDSAKFTSPSVRTWEEHAAKDPEHAHPYDQVMMDLYNTVRNVVVSTVSEADIDALYLDKSDDVSQIIRTTLKGFAVEHAIREAFSAGSQGKPAPKQSEADTVTGAFHAGFMFSPAEATRLAGYAGLLRRYWAQDKLTKEEYPCPTHKEFLTFCQAETAAEQRGAGITDLIQKTCELNIHTAKIITALQRSPTYKTTGAFLFGGNWMAARLPSPGVTTDKQGRPVVKPDMYVEYYWGTDFPVGTKPKGWMKLHCSLSTQVWLRVKQWSDVEKSTMTTRATKDPVCVTQVSSKDIILPLINARYQGGSLIKDCTVSRLMLYCSIQPNRLAQDTVDAYNYAMRGGASSSNISKLCLDIAAKGTRLPWVPIAMRACMVQQATARDIPENVQAVMSLNTISGSNKEQAAYVNRLGNVEAQLKVAYDSLGSKYPGFPGAPDDQGA